MMMITNDKVASFFQDSVKYILYNCSVATGLVLVVSKSESIFLDHHNTDFAIPVGSQTSRRRVMERLEADKRKG